jgi:hypothetical protein
MAHLPLKFIYFFFIGASSVTWPHCTDVAKDRTRLALEIRRPPQIEVACLTTSNGVSDNYASKIVKIFL